MDKSYNKDMQGNLTLNSDRANLIYIRDITNLDYNRGTVELIYWKLWMDWADLSFNKVTADLKY